MPHSDFGCHTLDEISSCKCSIFPTCLLSDRGESTLTECISSMKSDPRHCRVVLREWISSEPHSPPFQFVWRLNEEEIMFVTTYFYLLPHKVDDLLNAYELVYTTLDDSPRKSSARTILANIVATIINTLTNPCEKIKAFFTEVTLRLVKLVLKLVDAGTIRGNHLDDLLDSVLIFDVCLAKFFHISLKQLLIYPSEGDFSTTIRCHTKVWTSKTMDVWLNHFISKHLSSVEPMAVVSELRSAAALAPIRWKFFLSVVSIFVAEHLKAASLLKSLIDEWLTAGLEEGNKDLLRLAVITARHCCAEKTNFPNYITWFGSVQPTNPSNFSTFYSFLSELVPYELPLYLKIHVNKVPTAPPTCQVVLTDYISLAKTRLSDLNQTTDYLSIFNECHDTDEESLAADVAQLLSHFEATKEIAKPVIEASVFRKQYYEKVFLRYLLESPQSKDPTRAAVIRKLHSLGKIPPSLYSTWNSLS